VISFCGCQAAFALEGNHSCATRGHKNSRVHSRGSEGGLSNDQRDFSLIRSLARSLPASQNAGLDEHEPAGLLASRSSYSASLTILADSGVMAFRRSLQRRYRAGFTPASLFSPSRGVGHWFTLRHTANCMAIQRTAPLIDFCDKWSQLNFCNYCLRKGFGLWLANGDSGAEDGEKRASSRGQG